MSANSKPTTSSNKLNVKGNRLGHDITAPTISSIARSHPHPPHPGGQGQGHGHVGRLPVVRSRLNDSQSLTDDTQVVQTQTRSQSQRSTQTQSQRPTQSQTHPPKHLTTLPTSSPTLSRGDHYMRELTRARSKILALETRLAMTSNLQPTITKLQAENKTLNTRLIALKAENEALGLALRQVDHRGGAAGDDHRARVRAGGVGAGAGGVGGTGAGAGGGVGVGGAGTGAGARGNTENVHPAEGDWSRMILELRNHPRFVAMTVSKSKDDA
ncbi:hypothetical protein M231_05614 [Tremella mesenterica]|uniref:Uncharacterized protein n=1 Tax=Tremella mesenterica TaxID=5217 RepID=A0A4Q1BHK7_TREME|nr:hypothetical protein M231_05614 [Tremella mesenterica]